MVEDLTVKRDIMTRGETLPESVRMVEDLTVKRDIMTRGGRPYREGSGFTSRGSRVVNPH